MSRSLLVLLLLSMASTCYGLDWTELRRAVKQNNVGLIRHVAESNDINVKDERGNSLITYAVLKDKYNVVSLLIDKGADVNVKGPSMWTPIYLSVYGGSERVARLLISAGADVARRADNGITPLHVITSQTQAGVVQLLISKGADVNARDCLSISPLHAAVNAKNYSVSALLLKAGANIDAISEGGQTILISAVRAEAGSRLVNLLINSGANANAYDDDGNLPIFYAIKSSDPEVVCAIAQKMPSVNVKNKLGSTPILWAVHWNEMGVAKELLSRGAYLDLKTAAALGRLSAVKSALSKGADINSKDEFDNTALDYAVKYKQDDVSGYLGKLGARRGTDK